MIKTTHGKMVAAYNALIRIRQKAKGLDAKNMFHLKTAMREHFEFYAEQERNNIEELGGTLTEDGMILIPDKEKRKEYGVKKKELDEMECEIEADPVMIDLNANPYLTLEDMESLEGFVIVK